MSWKDNRLRKMMYDGLTPYYKKYGNWDDANKHFQSDLKKESDKQGYDWQDTLNSYGSELEEPKKAKKAEPVTPDAPPPPPPAPTTVMPEQRGGRTSYGVDINNVGLGNLGGWDLTLDGSMRGGNKTTGEKSSWDAMLTGTRGADINQLFGAAPLSNRSRTPSNPEYRHQERQMGDAIINEPAWMRARQAQAAAPAAADPLAPYLAAGIAPDQAQMLLDAGAPPPPARRQGGGPIYGIKNVPQMQQRQSPLGAAADFAKGQAMNYAINAAIPGGGMMAQGARAVLPTMFQQGGEVDNSTQRTPHSGNRGSAASNFLKKAWGTIWGKNNYKPQTERYKNDGGMIEHSSHDKTQAEAKKGGVKIGPLAKSVLKDKDGNSSERHYHNPMQAQNKPSSDK